MSLNDNQWIIEAFENRTAFSVRYEQILFDETSDLQTIRIVQTEAMGRVLLLNGCFMVTEKDTFIYHEMLVHPAMSVVPRPRDILVIGGGDGGAVTELVKYPQVESVTLCEIDPVVVSSCREFLPEISSGLSDRRVKVLYEDGAAFVARKPERFDLILVDSTDPVDHGKALFEVSFFQAVKDSLRSGGAAVFQTESPLFMEEVFVTAVHDLSRVFGTNSVHPYFATVPSYPGGLWSFTFCSPRLDVASPVNGRIPQGLSYYNDDVHHGALAQPVFVEQALKRTPCEERTGRQP